MGQAGISENHPTVPNYYCTDTNGNPTSKAYFRSSGFSPVSSATTFLPAMKYGPYVAPLVIIGRIPKRK
ncbi:MAG: hypothetical protein ACK5MK_09340 [Dysgonomonas sp.]